MNKRAQFVPMTMSMFTRWTISAGRANTRAAPGGVAQRWHDGVAKAKERLADEGVRAGRKLGVIGQHVDDVLLLQACLVSEGECRWADEVLWIG